MSRAQDIAPAPRELPGIGKPVPALRTGDPKLGAITTLLRRHFGHPERILVIGCGDGTEAALLAASLGGHVVGIDIAGEFHPSASGRTELLVADARQLPFPDGSFDLIFSFHALEHIPSPREAIAEMRRVVHPAGGFWLGTPNRSRLLGYLGSRDASSYDKLRWNLSELRTRLSGRFRNELGAHAGFTLRELREMLGAEFGTVEIETSAYYALLYPRQRRVLAILERSGLSRFVYPSVYVWGRP